jgi:hypothetical protein
VNILQQTNDYTLTFYFVQKCLFLAQNHQYKKGHHQNRLGPIFLDSVFLSYAKSTEQDDKTFFFSSAFNSQGV